MGGLGPRAFGGPVQLFPMTTQHKLKICETAQWHNFSEFTLKRAEMQMPTIDSYQYSSNTTILCIWAWERFKPSL